MNATKPYYFAFEINADHSLTGHCVRIETYHYPPNTFDQKNLDLLGKDRETDKRVEQLLQHGYENFRVKTEPTPEGRVSALKDEINRLAKLMNDFPVSELVGAITDSKLGDCVSIMIENRRKAKAIFQEIADESERTGRAMDLMRAEIRKLDSIRHNLDLLKDFTDVTERLANIEKSGFLARLKSLLQ